MVRVPNFNTYNHIFTLGHFYYTPAWSSTPPKAPIRYLYNGTPTLPSSHTTPTHLTHPPHAGPPPTTQPQTPQQIHLHLLHHPLKPLPTPPPNIQKPPQARQTPLQTLRPPIPHNQAYPSHYLQPRLPKTPAPLQKAHHEPRRPSRRPPYYYYNINNPA